MKQKGHFIILTLLLTAILLQVKSQTSFPTLTGNPTWNVYGTDNFWSGVFLTRNYNYQYDTTFCEQQYMRINSTPTHPNNVAGYVRVDNKRVYIRTSNNCADKEYLLYDFSLNVGDTVYCGYDISDTTQFWPTDIDTVTYFGIDRKRLKMNFYMGDPPFDIIAEMDWIEGIGSTTHPFYSTVCLTDNCETFYTLLCYDSSGTQLYQNPSYSTCYTTNVGIEETENKIDISIYPNPFSQSTTIEIGLENSEKIRLEIYSIKGRKIYDFTSNGNDTKFQIGNQLTQGTYLLKMSTESYDIIRKIVRIE